MRDELQVRLTTAVTNNHYTVLAVNGRPASEPDLVGRYTVDPVMGLLENGEAHAFYRNSGHGRFVKMSWTDGTFLDEDGRPSAVPYDWGLSVMFRDLNGDGAPDLYVCNDFHSPDRIWLNDGHGRFRAIPRVALRHTSLFSMGVDFADIDRDGRDDFFVADMLSRKHSSRQVQLMDRPALPLPLGAIENRPQYSRNTLFWNRGDGTYAEIAQYAGVEASDWTWCPVFLDVDLDGFEDLLLVTGHLRDAQNIDISRRIERLRREKGGSRSEQLSLRKMFLPLDVPNLAFRNRGDLTFEEVGRAWGFDSHKVSQGVALADLDNDGNLDVVINCLNDGPLLLRNETSRPRLAVRLRGLAPNTRGIGSRIKVSQAGMPDQSQEMICGGRYLSGDDAERVFAVKSLESELTIEVRWRSGRRSLIPKAGANRIYEIDESQARPAGADVREQGPAQGGSDTAGRPLTPTLSPSEGARESSRQRLEKAAAPGSSRDGQGFSLSPSEGERAGVRGPPRTSSPPSPTDHLRQAPRPMFTDVSDLIRHRHAEEEYDDYQRQPLLPHKLSQLGPGWRGSIWMVMAGRT